MCLSEDHECSLKKLQRRKKHSVFKGNTGPTMYKFVFIVSEFAVGNFQHHLTLSNCLHFIFFSFRWVIQFYLICLFSSSGLQGYFFSRVLIRQIRTQDFSPQDKSLEKEVATPSYPTPGHLTVPSSYPILSHLVTAQLIPSLPSSKASIFLSGHSCRVKWSGIV